MLLHYLLVIMFGLIIGSFVNVCIYRIPRRVSIITPASRCPHCQRRLKPWENIPLLSFILLGGRCASCRRPISWMYPVVEILTALALWSLYGKYGLSWPLLVNGIFFCMLIALMAIDLRERILPDPITLGGTVAGILLSPLQSREFFLSISWLGSFSESLLGAFLGGGILWLVAFLYLKLRRIEGLGLGDVKMMLMVGAFLSWRFAWMTIFLGSLVGAVAGGLFIFVLRKGRRYELPFGTFLALAALLVTLWGRQFLGWYLGS